MDETRRFLVAWHAEVSKRAEETNRSHYERASDQRLLERLAWACGDGRLSWRSFTEALERALGYALRQLDERLSRNQVVEVGCGEPGLLPHAWLDQHGGADIAVSFWEGPERFFDEINFDLIEVTVIGCGPTETIGRAYAAPDDFSSPQQVWYDVLRTDGMPAQEASRRARRLASRRSWWLPRRKRWPYRRFISHRFPVPHPVLIQWLQDARAKPRRDQRLIDQLTWATRGAGCLTVTAFEDALRRALYATQAAGTRSHLVEVSCARTDLVAQRMQQHWIITGRHADGDGPEDIDRVAVRQLGSDETATSTYASPLGLRPQEIADYERYRTAGLTMSSAYREVNRTRKPNPRLTERH